MNLCRKSRTDGTRTGGMSSAAYHLNGTCGRSIWRNRVRRPLFPSMIIVNTTPARLGPKSMTGNIRIPVAVGNGWWRISCGAATASAPIQEIKKVMAKYATRGCRFIIGSWVLANQIYKTRLAFVPKPHDSIFYGPPSILVRNILVFLERGSAYCFLFVRGSVPCFKFPCEGLRKSGFGGEQTEANHLLM